MHTNNAFDVSSVRALGNRIAIREAHPANQWSATKNLPLALRTAWVSNIKPVSGFGDVTTVVCLLGLIPKALSLPITGRSMTLAPRSVEKDWCWLPRCDETEALQALPRATVFSAQQNDHANLRPYEYWITFRFTTSST
jgi:hypothetical protein